MVATNYNLSLILCSFLLLFNMVALHFLTERPKSVLHLPRYSENILTDFRRFDAKSCVFIDMQLRNLMQLLYPR